MTYSEQSLLAKNWEIAYLLFKQGQLPREEYKQAIAIAARNARMIAEDINRPRSTRQNEIQKIYKKVYRIAKSVEKRGRSRGTGYSNWYLGYFNYWRYHFFDARTNYTQAYSDLSDNPDFLLDYGRLEYNTGRLIQAEQLFEQVFNHRDAITVQPLQIYRWLAKVYKLSGKFDKELSALEKLNDIVSVESKSFDSDDLRISQEFIRSRLGQAYLSVGKYESAFDFLASMVNDEVDNAVELAKLAIQALIKMERYDEADYWANEWTSKFKDKTILVAYLRLTRRIFSASKIRIEDIFSVHSDEAEKIVPFMYQHPYSRQVEIIERPQKMLIAYEAALQAFKEGFIDEGLEILFRAAEYGFDRSDALYVANLFSIIKGFIEVVPSSTKLDAIYAEAEQVFNKNPYIAVQCGHWYTSQEKYEKAQLAYYRANSLNQNEDEGLEVFLAVGYGNLGQHDVAQQLFKTMLLGAKKEDLHTVYREALKWAVFSNRYALALKWADDFMNYSTLGFGTDKKSKLVYEYAGRAALALRNYKLAAKYYEWAVISLAHWFSETQDNNSYLALATHAYVNLMWALSASLENDIETAEMCFKQAQALDNTNSLLPIVEAVIALQKHRFDHAINLLIGGHVDDWLFSLVGQYALNIIEENNIDNERVQKLKFQVEKAQGKLPEMFDLIKKIDEQSYSLEEIQISAQETYGTYLTLQRAFQTLVNNLPLTETEQNERDKLIKRIQSSEGDIEASVEAFVEILIKRSKKDITENRYQLQLPTQVWPRLSTPIKDRFDAAHSYIVAVEQERYDLGPALLALSSAAERLLRETLIDPLFKAIKRQNFKLLQDAPVKFKTVTLGQIPFMLAVKGNNVDPHYKKFVHTWVSETFSLEKTNYIFKILPGRIEKIAIDRNNWAHGGQSITTQEFNRFETLLFDADGVFIKLV